LPALSGKALAEVTQHIPDPEFLESEYREAQAEASRELQLVLDERVPLRAAMTPASCLPAARNRWWCAPTGRLKAAESSFGVRFLGGRTCFGPIAGAIPIRSRL